MKAFNDYVRDTCARLAEGTNPVRVAVYYDVRSVWAGGHDVEGTGEGRYRMEPRDRRVLGGGADLLL